MTTTTGDLVRVGNVEIPLATAAKWVRSYTDEERNTTSPRPYAYPAYDRFDRDGNDPHRLTRRNSEGLCLLQEGLPSPRPGFRPLARTAALAARLARPGCRPICLPCLGQGAWFACAPSVGPF